MTEQGIYTYSDGTVEDFKETIKKWNKTNTHISNNTLLKSLQINFPETYKQSVPHGFRSSFRDWAEKQHNFSRRAVELCLSHQNSNKTEDAYLRSQLLNKRHHIMNEWDTFLKGEIKYNAKLKSI